MIDAATYQIDGLERLSRSLASNKTSNKMKVIPMCVNNPLIFIKFQIRTVRVY